MIRVLGRRAFSSAVTPSAGRLLICGTGESHKLGLGDVSDRETPTPVEALADVPIAHVSCGSKHTMALSADGDVYAWGLESSGQLGLGSYRTKAQTPTKVEALSGIGIQALSCGLYHSLALSDSGDVYSFGFGGSFFNGVGGLGQGDRKQLETPAKLDNYRAVSVSAGGYHSVALDADGEAWSWGRGEWGRLGHMDSSDCYEPTLLECKELGKVAAIYAGDVHSGALNTDGQVFTWGRNENWQLGYEVSGLLNAGQSLDAQQEPQLVELPAAATKLSCGELGTAALLETGEVYAWGMGRFFEPTKLPTDAAVDDAIVDVHVGAYHLALLSASGRLWTFGTGAPLALPRGVRQQWEVREVAFEGRRVLSCATGPYTTAVILEE